MRAPEGEGEGQVLVQVDVDLRRASIVLHVVAHELARVVVRRCCIDRGGSDVRSGAGSEVEGAGGLPERPHQRAWGCEAWGLQAEGKAPRSRCAGPPGVLVDLELVDDGLVECGPRCSAVGVCEKGSHTQGEVAEVTHMRGLVERTPCPPGGEGVGGSGGEGEGER